jgi:hypothetical protein
MAHQRCGRAPSRICVREQADADESRPPNWSRFRAQSNVDTRSDRGVARGGAVHGVSATRRKKKERIDRLTRRIFLVGATISLMSAFKTTELPCDCCARQVVRIVPINGCHCISCGWFARRRVHALRSGSMDAGNGAQPQPIGTAAPQSVTGARLFVGSKWNKNALRVFHICRRTSL